MSHITRIKGTQDLLDLTLFTFITDQFTQHASLYHFEHIATPIIEPVDLFVRSLGQHTDVVTKEMFIIEKGEHSERICLRPEATASTMRAFVEHNPLTPWKVFTYGPMFRYERPQKGRFRQFHQISLEIIGSSSISQDAQLITMLDRFFHEKLKLTNYALMINFLGTPEDRVAYREILKNFLHSSAATGICETCVVRRDKNVMRVFDCKNPDCQKIYEKAPLITDHLSQASKQEWEQLQRELSLLSVTFAYNPRLVRGLDYYNKTVFEFVSDNLGAQNAFCGGGRYDQLATQIGAKTDYPSIGAAMGIDRLVLMLETMKDKIAFPQPAPLYIIMPLSPAQNPLALLLADTMHAANLATDTLLDGASLKNMMNKANKMGAAYALILGEDEQQHKKVLVKNMMTGNQEQVLQIDVVKYLKR